MKIQRRLSRELTKPRFQFMSIYNLYPYLVHDAFTEEAYNM